MIDLNKLKGPSEGNSPQESDIYPKASQRRSPVFNPAGRVEYINSDEIKIADVRRHPIGLMIIYFQTFFGLGVAFLLIFLLLPTFLDSLGFSSTGGFSLLVLFMIFVSLLGLVFLVLAAMIYQRNQLIVTDTNITQVLQIGLFNRKVSELSMNNVEDVTAVQHGILQTFFNYGTLAIETAGEQNNFKFIYCPNPNAYAKAILDARHNFVEKHGANTHH